MVEEAARQVVALRTDRCRAEPRRTGESFASILHDLEALSESTIAPDNTGVLAGMVRVFDGIEDGKVTGDRHRELAEDRGTAANSSLAEAGWSVWLMDGQRWQEGNVRADFNDSWDGQASFGDDDIIGLLFDATEGNLVAYKNGVKLGFVFEAGEIPTKHGMSRTALEPSHVLGYCWAVDVLYHGQGVEVLNVNPALLEAHNARLQHVMFEGHNDQASSEED